MSRQQNPLMLSNFGLSSKSQPRNYEKLVEDPMDAYSESHNGGKDSKRVQKSKSALSRYINESRRMNGNNADADFDDIPSEQLQAEL